MLADGFSGTEPSNKNFLDKIIEGNQTTFLRDDKFPEGFIKRGSIVSISIEERDELEKDFKTRKRYVYFGVIQSIGIHAIYIKRINDATDSWERYKSYFFNDSRGFVSCTKNLHMHPFEPGTIVRVSITITETFK